MILAPPTQGFFKSQIFSDTLLCIVHIFNFCKYNYESLLPEKKFKLRHCPIHLKTIEMIHQKNDGASFRFYLCRFPGLRGEKKPLLDTTQPVHRVAVRIDFQSHWSSSHSVCISVNRIPIVYCSKPNTRAT